MSTENLTSLLTQMMVSGNFSDLKFVCQGDEFKVHKAIVCGQSPVINAAIRGGFEVGARSRLCGLVLSGNQESHSNTIKMDKFEPNIVAQLVKFLYTGDYDDYEHEDPMESASSENDKEADTQVSAAEDNDVDSLSAEPSPPMPDSAASLIHHVQVNCIGEFYAIDSLVSLANSKIEGLIDAQADNKDWASYLPLATEVALESTGDDGLLNMLASASAENMAILIDDEDFRSLEALSDFSLRVLEFSDRKIRHLTESVNRVEGQLAELGTNFAVESGIYEEKIKGKGGLMNELKQCLAKLNDNPHCRNISCDSEVGCYISAEERILRCRKCKCKH